MDPKVSDSKEEGKSQQQSHGNPDRIQNIETGVGEIKDLLGKTVVPRLDNLEHRVDSVETKVNAAEKTLAPMVLRVQGKWKEANMLEGTQQEEGLKGAWQYAKQKAATPLTGTDLAIGVAGTVGAATVYDLAMDIFGASSPRTGVLSYFKGFFGSSSSKKR